MIDPLRFWTPKIAGSITPMPLMPQLTQMFQPPLVFTSHHSSTFVRFPGQLGELQSFSYPCKGIFWRNSKKSFKLTKMFRFIFSNEINIDTKYHLLCPWFFEVNGRLKRSLASLSLRRLKRSLASLAGVASLAFMALDIVMEPRDLAKSEPCFGMQITWDPQNPLGYTNYRHFIGIPIK